MLGISIGMTIIAIILLYVVNESKKNQELIIRLGDKHNILSDVVVEIIESEKNSYGKDRCSKEE